MSSKTQITQRADFECSYILPLFNRYELHSHRYRIEVTVEGPQRLEDFGMVLEFDRFKSILNTILPNRSFIYQAGEIGDCFDVHLNRVVSELNRLNIRLYSVPMAPTVENLCSHFASELQSVLDSQEPGVRVVNLKLRESTDSFASWSIEKETV